MHHHEPADPLQLFLIHVVEFRLYFASQETNSEGHLSMTREQFCAVSGREFLYAM